LKFKWLLVFMMLISATCQAQTTDIPQPKTVSIDNIPKLDRSVKMTQPAFEAVTKQINEIPLNNKFLAYKIRLPSNWASSNGKLTDTHVDLSKRILGNVVEYLGPPVMDIRSSFRIRANDLTYDVSAKDWFLSYVFSNNYLLEGMDITSETRVQAQYVMVDNGNQYRVRAVAEITGPWIILVDYIVPVDAWDQEQDIAKRAMASFSLANIDPSQIEVMQTFKFVDIAQFNYPSSWLLNAPPITSIERMSASLINLKGTTTKTEYKSNMDSDILMDGRIDVSIVTKSKDVKIDKEIVLLKNQMLAKNLVIGDLIQQVNGWPYHEGIIFSKIEAYKVNNTEGRLAGYEQWVGIFETPGRYYFVRLLTVGRQDDFLTWARNTKAYKTVISTLSPVAK